MWDGQSGELLNTQSTGLYNEEPQNLRPYGGQSDVGIAAARPSWRAIGRALNWTEGLTVGWTTPRLAGRRKG